MPLQLDQHKTALVLIDLQYGIVTKPAQPYASTAVVEQCRSMAEAFRSKRLNVVYVHVDLGNLLPLISDRSLRDPNAAPPSNALELVPYAGFQKGDLLVTKRHWSAFGQTSLEALLRERGVETVVLAGISTNFGVESTARHAVALGFQVVIAENACSSISTAAHRFAMETVFPLIARVRTAEEIINAIACGD
jgi:nicotinamidase-related amidase